MQIKLKMDSSWTALIRQLHKAAVDMPETMDKLTAIEGEALRAEIVKGIRDQAPGGKPFLRLSKLTLITRQMRKFRGKKVLMVSGQLIAGIRVKVRRSKAFVGVPESIKREERGQELWRIAQLQENGGVVVMRRTPRMMRFLMALFRKANLGKMVRMRSRRTGKFIKSRWQPKGARRVKGQQSSGKGSSGVIVIRIPPRPYIAPAVKKYQESKLKISKRVLSGMERALVGRLGSGTTGRAGRSR